MKSHVNTLVCLLLLNNTLSRASVLANSSQLELHYSSSSLPSSFPLYIPTMFRLPTTRISTLLPSRLRTTRSYNAATDIWSLTHHEEPHMTKIVCTIGPSTDTSAPIQQLVNNGMNVARLNFSHAGDDYTYPENCLALVRGANGRHAQLSAGSTIDMPNNLRAVLVDTKGPEIRTGVLQGGVDVVELETGCVVEVTTEDVSMDAPPESAEGPHRLNVDYPSIATTLKVGSQVLLDDGLIALEVTHVENNSVTCVALNGGPIKKNKGVNLPDSELDLPALTEKDKRDLK